MGKSIPVTIVTDVAVTVEILFPTVLEKTVDWISVIEILTDILVLLRRQFEPCELYIISISPNQFIQQL